MQNSSAAPELGHVEPPEHVVPVPPELDPLLLLHAPPELLPPPPLDVVPVQLVAQLCVSQVPRAWVLLSHVVVIWEAHALALHASNEPPGHTQSTYTVQSVSNAPSSGPHAPCRHDQHALPDAAARHELPPLLLPTPLLLPPVLPPPVHESRLKPLHSLVHALHEPRPEVAELQAGEICEAHACALQPSYDPLEHMQSTNGAHLSWMHA
jgi:hypothetical protein